MAKEKVFTVLEHLVDKEMVASRSVGRRLIRQGAVRMGGKDVRGGDQPVDGRVTLKKGGSGTTGDRIRRIREALEETQVQFAERLGVGEIAVCRWETDVKKPNFDNWNALLDLERLHVKT